MHAWVYDTHNIDTVKTGIFLLNNRFLNGTSNGTFVRKTGTKQTLKYDQKITQKAEFTQHRKALLYHAQLLT